MMNTAWLNEICGLGLSFTTDGFRLLYVGIALFMWLCATLFCIEYEKGEKHQGRFYFFWFATLATVVGVLFSADLFTLFLFFELMSFTSFVWVVQEEKKESLHAGGLYLGIAIGSGLVLLMGLMLLYHELGTVVTAELPEAIRMAAEEDDTVLARLFAAACLMLVGFGAKAGLFLLHVWLPKAHTVAPAPASALLSGILTKMGIFGILILSGSVFLTPDSVYAVQWGQLLLVLGILTMVTGAFLALFSVNLKRTLACSSVSQMGFVVTGISMTVLLHGNAMAMSGTLLHMVNHSLIKLTLFLCAGVVFRKVGSLELNEIRGYGRGKYLLHAAFLIGAYSIAGIPLGSGYVSKTLIHESMLSYQRLWQGMDGYGWLKAAEWLFLITGGMTLAYMLKLYFCIFWEKGEAEKKPSCKPLTMAVILAPAALLLVFGWFPNPLMNRLAEAGQLSELPVTTATEMVSYFSVGSLQGAAISVFIGLMLYFGFVRTVLRKKEHGAYRYVDRLPKWVDLADYVYIPVFVYFLPFVLGFFSRVCDRLVDGLALFLRKKVFCARKKKRPVAVGSGLTYAVGSVLDGLVGLCNRTFRKKRPIERSFVDLLAISRAEMDATGRLIVRSVSFGLLMFCIGLLVTLIYLLFS